jgi:hypothetical protein
MFVGLSFEAGFGMSWVARIAKRTRAYWISQRLIANLVINR